MDDISKNKKVRDAAILMVQTDSFTETGFCGVAFEYGQDEETHLALYDSKKFTVIPWEVYQTLLSCIPKSDSEYLQ